MGNKLHGTTGGGRKKIGLLVLLVIVLAVLLCLPMIRFALKSRMPVVTALLDKTVPDESEREHAGLLWYLRHEKIADENGQIPPTHHGILRGEDGSYTEMPLSEVPEDTDLLYIVDTYGLYRDAPLVEGVSNLIYGGLTQSDVDAVRRFLNRDRASTVVAEYNTFGTPTHPTVRSQMERMLQTSWTGWVGHYVHDLAEEGRTVEWERARYEQVYGKPWSFTGSGYVLVDEETDILVLSDGIDVGTAGLAIRFTEEGAGFGDLGKTIPYQGLFDLVSPLEDGQVLATYSLDVTGEGARKLRSKGLESNFPAVIRSETAQDVTYYLAGNYAALNYTPRLYFWEGVVKRMQKAGDADLEAEDAFYWKTYIPLLDGIYREALERKQKVPEPVKTPVFVEDGVSQVARTGMRLLQVYDGERWKDFFIRGVNLGTALPGRWYTDFPDDKGLYYRFLEQIGGMHANTVRIYTLLDPPFYQALELYNRLHPEEPLYLLQEIWPEEEPEENDYLTEPYMAAYRQEIRYVVDALHGNATIAPRSGRAYGTYDSDVSPYLLGLLVGRELEPQEVEATDSLNEGHSFAGQYLYTNEQATPTEAWLAESADYALSFQMDAYGWQCPVAIVNWPTLDVLDHPSERESDGTKEQEYNDRVSVDIEHIEEGPGMKGGLFGAYHIYPNYPDFMNNDPQYEQYRDEEGPFRYGGYLEQFMQVHRKYPALVAEFGLATGMGNAHMNPDGYNHGGMDETEQGEGIVRMFEAIGREGYAGGVIFEWMDEWAKKTWVTEPYMIPYDRKVLWHNAVDPEQNYGILAMESVKPSVSDLAIPGTVLVDRVDVSIDASYLYIDLVFRESLELGKRALFVGLDTYAPDRGEIRYDEDLPYRAPSGMEYLLSFAEEDRARLLVIPPYDFSAYRFASYPSLSDEGIFVSMKKIINKARAQDDGTPIPAIYEDTSALERSDDQWRYDGKTLSVRIPWTRINVSDPSRGRVLDDPGTYHTDPTKDALDTVLSEGIGLSFLIVDKETGAAVESIPAQGTQERIVCPWRPWDEPEYRQRLKDSYGIIQSYFAQLEKE
jgi:hypothetical protein